jgi:hypothetical protein
MKFNQIHYPAKTAIGASIVFYSLIFLVASSKVSAQQWSATDEEKITAYQHLLDLKDGILIIVLKADQKKIIELRKIIDSQTAKPSQKRRAEKHLKKVLRDKRNFHLDLVESFHQIYTFSKFQIIYDHDLSAYMDGQTGLFLNRTLEYDPLLEVSEEDNVYYAREGYTNMSGDRVLSYIVYDAEGIELDFPFPSVKLTDVGPAMLYRSIFEKSDYRPASSIVERFDFLLKHRMATLRAAVELMEDMD